MNILTICSALNNSYIAFNYDDKEISKIIKSDENYHSLYIINEIKNILSKYNINLKNLDAIGVNTGPGSFTGIRVALSIAKVMAGELNIPLIPLNTTEILLEAYFCDYLLMDARKDMVFLGTKDKIELIYKNKIPEEISNKKLLCDINCHKIFPNSICYETDGKDLGLIMLKLAQDRYNKTKDKDEFNYLKIQANYIQTPPVV